MSSRDDADGAATGRWLVGLTLLALLVGGLGFAVVWALTYGPLG
ncbi:MAG: hypothetical protein ABEH47_05190 [Haloferacaceae archaeon]